MTDIFVFGSNLRGAHGAGAAKFAMQNHGAQWGVGSGLTGNSYALPTKDDRIQTLSLAAIEERVRIFLDFARAHPEMTFYVTPVGCGLAGYKREQIRPFFEGMPSNCRFAETW